MCTNKSCYCGGDSYEQYGKCGGKTGWEKESQDYGKRESKGKEDHDYDKRDCRCNHWEKDYLGKKITECRFYRKCQTRFFEKPCENDHKDCDCGCGQRA